MPAIIFKNIRTEPKGQRDSFEIFSVQLFNKVCPAPEGSIFTSLRGDGGDGGVEAFFTCTNGQKIAVQSKYFFKLESSELSQINSSLQTALDVHPTIVEYWIYIPFDLTGPTKRGKGELNLFEDWKTNVEKDAIKQGKNLKIVLCSAQEISNQLIKVDDNGGMRKYWFDETILTKSYIESCLDSAIAHAGPRYTSDINITTNAQLILDFFGHTAEFAKLYEDNFAPLLSKLKSEEHGWGVAFDILEEQEKNTLHSLLHSIKEITTQFNKKFIGVEKLNYAVSTFVDCIDKCFPLLEKAEEIHRTEFESTHGLENDTRHFRDYHREFMADFPAGNLDLIRDLINVINALKNKLKLYEMSAWQAKSLRLLGTPGIGKTHAIISTAKRRFANNAYSLVVFGDNFDSFEPWEVIRTQLGFGTDINREKLFSCLQTCAEHTGLPFVIFIDALNESPRKAYWKTKLPELLAQCKQYKMIKICVSIRNTYLENILEVESTEMAFTHHGFIGHEYEAIQGYASLYGLPFELTPVFISEFCNPLYLKMVCEVLKKESHKSLNIALRSFTNFFESYLSHCNDNIKARDKHSDRRNIVLLGMRRLAEILTTVSPVNSSWDSCVAELSKFIGNTITPEDFLEELHHEGLLIFSENEEHDIIVRFSFQLFCDVLRATALIENSMTNGSCCVKTLSKQIADVQFDKEGLLEALAFILPEKVGIEIVTPELNIDQYNAYKHFIDGLLWRSKESFTDITYEHLYGALQTKGLWTHVYEKFFGLALIPNHPINIKNWLHMFYMRQPLVERDTYFSHVAFSSFEEKKTVFSLINNSLKADMSCWSNDALKLVAHSLAWLCSCADRRIRDLSSKALARLFSFFPNIGEYIIQHFVHHDDEYILESIVQAIYSAALLSPDKKNDFLPILDALLVPTFDIPNVLIRDSIRLMGEYLSDENVPQKIIDKLSLYPQKVFLPDAWPSWDNAKQFLGIKDLPFNMKLTDGGLQPDFWRYQVEPKLNRFDLKSSSITPKDIMCWFMVETLKLGYPGQNSCAFMYEYEMRELFGISRNREVYAERLGKKYYWILLHRLIGILSDNVKPMIGYFDETVPDERFLWSLEARKSDITDVRDIVQKADYPIELLEKFSKIIQLDSDNRKKWIEGIRDIFPQEYCISKTQQLDEEWVLLELSVTKSYKDKNYKPCDPYFLTMFSWKSIFISNNIEFDILYTNRDIFDSNARSSYKGYLAEYPNSPVYIQLLNDDYFTCNLDGIDFCSVGLERGANWQYDYSFLGKERQERLNAPCKDLINRMNLHWDKQSGWVNNKSELCIVHMQEDENSAYPLSGLFIKRKVLNNYLETTKKRLIYRVFRERSYIGHNNDERFQIEIWTWLKYNSVKKTTQLHTKEDVFGDKNIFLNLLK